MFDTTGDLSMARISLGAYRLRVKDQSGKSLKLDSLAPGTDLIDVLLGYVKELKRAYSHDVVRKKLLRVDKAARLGRLLNGVIETGEYGFESNLFDLGKKVVSYKRSTQEAEMLPFYFLFDVPNNLQWGTVLLQRFRQFGMRRILLESLREHFSQKYPDYTISLRPIVPSGVVNRYLTQGRVTKVRFVSHKIPQDIADAYDDRAGAEETGHLELVLVAKRDGWLPLGGRIRAFLSRKRTLRNLIELDSFDYEDVKVEIDLNGSRRTIDLNNLGKIRSYIDVSDQVKILANGHPSFESIDAIAKELLRDLKESGSEQER